MTNGRDASKDLPMGNLHVPMTPKRESMREIDDWGGPAGSLDANSARQTRAARIRFRFVPILIIMARDQLWTSALCLWMDSWCGCADSANHIT